MKTMIALILDRSGSMNGREADVIGGVNQFLADQKALAEPASVAFVRFDTEVERFRSMTALENVEPLTDTEFRPRGSTALLDAVGQTIVALDEDWKTEQPDRAILVIVTDGEENASQEFNREKVKSLIEAREASGLWSVIYLGANVDAFAEGASLGVRSANTASYLNTQSGTAGLYRSLSNSVATMRSSGRTDAGLGGSIQGDGSVQQVPTPAKATAPIAAAKPWTPPSAATPNTPATNAAWTPPTA